MNRLNCLYCGFTFKADLSKCNHCGAPPRQQIVGLLIPKSQMGFGDWRQVYLDANLREAKAKEYQKVLSQIIQLGTL